MIYLHDADMRIVDVRRTDVPRYGVRADGYSARSGAPTCYLVKVAGGRLALRDVAVWRRIRVWQWSNAGTAFVRIRGCDYVIRDCDLPA